MNKEFEDLVNDTTHHTILASIPIDNFDTRLIVMKYNDEYDINRYFTIGEKWYVSYDHRGLSEEVAWQKIEEYIKEYKN